MEIQETKPVYVAWTNTDLTEGRGLEYPLCVAESMETAQRHGYKKSVQGGNCRVSEETAVKVKGIWLIPGRILPESQEDLKKRINREEKEAVLAKVKSLGLSESEVAVLAKS